MLNILRTPLHLADTSDSFSDITHTGFEAAPEAVQVSLEGKNRIWRAVESLYRTGTQPMISLCIRRQGKLLINRAIGYAEGNGPGDLKHAMKRPATVDTPVCLYSSSKAMTAILMHKLAEQGLINLLDPVSHYLPEFAKNGKRTITIHQILSHRGGIPGLPTHLPLETLYDNDAVWNLLCDAKPIAVDGAKLAYHAISGGFVLAKVLEEVTGQSIQTYMEKHLRKPLDMNYFTFGLAKEDRYKAAKNYATGPHTPFPLSWFVKRALGASFPLAAEVSNSESWMNAVIPAANIYATAEETSRFYQMMLDDGRYKSRTVLKEETVRRATQEFGSCTIDRTMLIPMRYSAGLMLGGNPFGLYGQRTSKAYGHIGLINKFCWADPERQIAVAVLTTGLCLISHHLPALIKLLSQINDVCGALERT